MPKARPKAAKAVAALLETEKVALDAGAYRDAPPGLRIRGAGDGGDIGYCRTSALDRLCDRHRFR